MTADEEGPSEQGFALKSVWIQPVVTEMAIPGVPDKSLLCCCEELYDLGMPTGSEICFNHPYTCTEEFLLRTAV